MFLLDMLWETCFQVGNMNLGNKKQDYLSKHRNSSQLDKQLAMQQYQYRSILKDKQSMLTHQQDSKILQDMAMESQLL